MTLTPRSLLLLSSLSLGACGGGSDASFDSRGSDAASTSSMTDSEMPSPDSQPGSDARMTAGTWDDNLNYGLFWAYLDKAAELGGQPDLTERERDDAQEQFGGDREPNVDVDVALVIDTTGSMGDELGYLERELGHIADKIDEVAPDASIRWSLVVYRDRGDAYVTRSFDFTADLDDFQSELASHEAAGGGDYPEASHEALLELMTLDWRSRSDVARLAFWITDAPHPSNASSVLTGAMRDAVEQDVHLYPIAASGVDELAEVTMRSAAQVTGGRYMFLTDDSGIGDTHKEPRVPCYFVTTLADAMTRMIDIERTGVYVEPAADEIIRTGGDPENGACTLEDGSTAVVF